MPIPVLIVKSVENKAIYSVQELHLCLLLSSDILASFTSSAVSVHSSTNLLTKFFLHLQFSQCKYSSISHDLSHSHSQLLGFQIDPLLHTHLSINYLYSHLHLLLFQRCLLLQTLPSNLHLHLQVSCHSMCFASSVLDIRLNTLTFKFLTTSGTHIFAYGSLILLHLPLHLLVLILKRKNTGSSLLTLTVYGLSLHSWLFIEIHFNGALNQVKLVDYNQKTLLFEWVFILQTQTFYYTMLCFSLNNCEFLIFHQLQ